jgi:hypothetical protein
MRSALERVGDPGVRLNTRQRQMDCAFIRVWDNRRKAPVERPAGERVERLIGGGRKQRMREAHVIAVNLEDLGDEGRAQDLVALEN